MTKHNTYFDGKVQSLSFERNGRRATAGRGEHDEKKGRAATGGEIRTGWHWVHLLRRPSI